MSKFYALLLGFTLGWSGGLMVYTTLFPPPPSPEPKELRPRVKTKPAVSAGLLRRVG